MEKDVIQMLNIYVDCCWDFFIGLCGVCVCWGVGGVIILIIKIDSIAITLGTRCDTLSLKFDLIHCSLFKSFQLEFEI